jgi:hypothetical protein
MRFPARLTAALALGLPFTAHADPNDYIQVPAVEYGEREIELKGGSWKLRGDDPVRQSAAALSLGYGATPWWFTEAYVNYEKESPERFKYDAFEWENKFQLTEPNKYFVDVGLLAEIEVPHDHATAGYELKLGPLFQWDTGDVRWNANLFLARYLRGQPEEPRHTELQYQLQARVPVRRGLEVGAQAFGEVGPWNDWAPRDEQLHRVGPAVFGKVKLEGRQSIKWNAAYLFPLTDSTPKNSLRFQVEYEF